MSQVKRQILDKGHNMKSEVSKRQRFDQSGQVKCHRLKQKTVSNNTPYQHASRKIPCVPSKFSPQGRTIPCQSGVCLAMCHRERFNDACQCVGGFDGLNIILTAERSH